MADYDVLIRGGTLIDGTGAPAQHGIEAVLVNGNVIREGGEDVVDPDGELPGQVLRGGQQS